MYNKYKSNNMRSLSCFLILYFILGINPCYSLDIDAKAVILMDQHTRRVLFEKNSDEMLPIASTTKIATAIVALDLADLKEEVIISEYAANVGEASIDLLAGEKLSLQNLLLGTLIESGNDAAVAVGEQVAGSEQEFVLIMNKKAKLLGASRTNFINPNGLPATDHLSTAHDLALIASYAMEHPVFREIVQIKTATIPNSSNSWNRYLKNTNKLLWRYPLATGIKTGTTDAAGPCLVASARKGDTDLIAVVLASNDRFGQAQELLEWGFANYKTDIRYLKGQPFDQLLIPSGKPESISVSLAEDVHFIKKKDELVTEKTIWFKPELPMEKGTEVGRLVLTDETGFSWSVAILADQQVEAKTFRDKLEQRFK